MPTQEIAAQNWLPFFDTFSKQHADAAASVEVVSPDMGAQELIEPMPLTGISFDDEGSEEGGIVLMLGSDPDTHIEHLIKHPTRVWLKADGAPMEDALEIEDADHTKTIVKLHAVPAISG